MPSEKPAALTISMNYWRQDTTRRLSSILMSPRTIFKIATEFGDIGARITRVNERFIIKIKPPKA